MQKPNRIARNEDDLISALSDNLDLLEEAIKKSRAGDFKYIKVIKGILRVLVYTSKSNIPLLIELAKKYSVIPTIKTEGPRGVFERPLDIFLEEIGFASGTENIILKNIDLIVKGSQQEGGAHEDWDIDKDYLFSKGDGLLIGGIPPLVRKFIGMSNCIHISGVKVLKEIEAARRAS